MERQPITKSGYAKLREDLSRMEAQMPEIVAAIAEARAEGDLSENAEYHGQRERQGQLKARIDELKAKINSCYIVDMSNVDKDSIDFGSVVTVKDLDDDTEERYEFVGPGEEDFMTDPVRMLTTSPLAQAMLGKKVGDLVEAETPGGQLRLEVVGIEYPEA